MITPYERLAKRIRNEIPDMELVLERMQKAWQKSMEGSDAQELYLDSVALNLQSFYSGIERLFELIARYVDRSVPDGESWHRDLVQQMAQDIQDIRPAVIGESSTIILDELRKFRHVVVNIYTVNLVPEKMCKLVLSVNELWPKLNGELMAFAEFLDEVSRE